MILDLCSGTGSATRYFPRNTVVQVDNNIAFKPDILADVRDLPLLPGQWELIWASPPCNEFSLARGSNKVAFPDLSIFHSIVKYINLCLPCFYCIENVRGAQQYFGKSNQRVYSWYFWTNLPAFAIPTTIDYKNTENIRSPVKRAMLPAQIAKQLPTLIKQGVIL